MQRQKRALAVHDISCVGRCSLTVALPIISAVGVETSILPTAVLSTHTGGFTGYTYRDLTEDILPIADHWESLGLSFDALYTGYLGSFRQIELVLELFRRFKGKDTLALVDPAMADNGKLYGGFAAEFPQEMRKLCAKADIIVPNLTEAAFMLDEPYVEGPYTQAYIEGMLERLAEIGAPKVVLTGVHFDDKDLGAACLDAATGKVSYAFQPRIPGYYHGTGDVFGSALLAALLRDRPLEEAAAIAVDYTQRTIAMTAELKQEARYGVCFERTLPYLLERLA